MFNDYGDIRERIAETPKWWDERGVPRYADFEPSRIADVYSQEAALIEVACAACKARLQVACSNIDADPLLKYGTPLADKIRRGELSYSEPPAHGNCEDGPSMSCQELRVLQYWYRGHRSGAWGGGWVRDPRLEVDLPGAKTSA